MSSSAGLSFDRRHVLVTTWTYRLPFMRQQHGFAGRVLGGWELSGKTRWQSGQYLTVSGNTSTGTRRADYVGGEISIDDRTTERWFNTEAFEQPAAFTFGNAGCFGETNAQCS